MADYKCITSEVAKLSIFYPYPQRGAEELEVLSTMWMKDLAELSNEEFCAAVAHWRRSERYWPTSADLLELVASGWCRKVARQAELPEKSGVKSDEERQRDLEQARKILREVCGRV